MNILPKKSWHVRNKDNIERVRKDEEQAANEEKERQRRIALAESEARTDLLRQRARAGTSIQSDDSHVESASSTSQKHMNFFEEFELGTKVHAKNAEHEAEKKQEKERQEKAIGLLTYLGQGSVELEATKPWYLNHQEKRKVESEANATSAATKSKDEFDAKRKRASDPMKAMDVLIDQSKKVRSLKDGKSADVRSHKSHRSSAKDSRPTAAKNIEQLRAERLRREQNERERSRQLLAKLHGDNDNSPVEQQCDERSRRYNSQFNPEIARRPMRPEDRDKRL